MSKMQDYRQNIDKLSNRECYIPIDKGNDFYGHSYLAAEEKNKIFVSHLHEHHFEYQDFLFGIIKKGRISSIEKQFNELSIKWKLETGLFSTTFDKINDTYLDIIAMGKDVLPFILKDIQKTNGTAHWHSALKAITRENPVPNEDLTKTRKIKEAWIEWGKRKNLI